MSRRKHGKPVHGLVLLDKPEGITSNRALQMVRRLFGARKAGHTGSLDPFATGMLPLCLGEATKTAAYMLDADKRYRATMKLGQATETGDTEGRVSAEMPVPDLQEAEIHASFESFVGEIEQLPPMYSALKHQGQPLYKLARAGETVARTPRTVTISEMMLLHHDQATITFEVRCSKGTYIRTLAEDIGASLGSCAHLVGLRRLWVHPFENDAMVSLDQLEQEAASGLLSGYLLPLDEGLRSWPICELAPLPAERFACGNPVDPGQPIKGWVRVRTADGKPLGLGEATGPHQLHPRRVFHFEAE